MAFTSYVIENDESFQRAIDRARRTTADLRIPLRLIAKDFYKSERAIFALKGKGQYPDITKGTKAEKRRLGYSVYPILKRTGRLADSLTKANDDEAINEITNKTVLTIGTKVPYAAKHQEGDLSINLPQRRILFIGPEAPRFATSEQMGRPQRWNSILNDYVLKVLEKELESV